MPGSAVLNWTIPHRSGRCMSITPCGDQTQLCSGRFGTFTYCNALDKDAAHYPGYTEPDWFHGGIRPSIFPWLVLPQVGLTFHPSRTVAIDLDTGISLSGILTSLGFRVAL